MGYSALVEGASEDSFRVCVYIYQPSIVGSHSISHAAFYLSSDPTAEEPTKHDFYLSLKNRRNGSSSSLINFHTQSNSQ